MAARSTFVDYQIPSAARLRTLEGSEHFGRVLEIFPGGLFVELKDVSIGYAERVIVEPLTDASPALVFHGVVSIAVRGRGVRIEAVSETRVEVFEALSEWAAGKPAMLTVTAGTPYIPPAPLPPRVLVIDDDPIVLRVLSRILARLGCEVRTAIESPRGLEMFSEGTFDAVLLDWMLPVMSGEEMLSKMRARDCVVPIAVISGGLWWNGAERELHQRGAAAVLRKPLDFDEISRFINSVPRSSDIRPDSSIV